MKKKNCKFCNRKTSSFFKAYNFYNTKNFGKIYECLDCDVMFQPNKIRNLYNNQDSLNYNLKKNIFFYIKQIIFVFSILKLKKYFFEKKKILDYGCGSGEFALTLSLYFRKKNIYTADVFNLDKKFIKGIKKHFLLNKGELKSKKFDLILMRHVFEHLFDLDKSTKEIKKNLKNNNSLLIIEIPNKNSIWRKIMKSKWPGYFYPFHYYVFSKKFLSNYFKHHGFEIVEKKQLEPPIFGLFLITYGINKSICKLLSLLLYPLQFLISKISFSSEALLLILKKK